MRVCEKVEYRGGPTHNGVRRVDVFHAQFNEQGGGLFTRTHYWVPVVDGREIAFCRTQREAYSLRVCWVDTAQLSM